MRQWLAGCDLGQRSDYTALSVIEAVQGEDGQRWNRPGERKPRFANWDDSYSWQYRVRALDRVRGYSYELINDQLAITCASADVEGIYLVVDQGGVGRPVYDGLIARGVPAVGVTLTSGANVSREPEPSLTAPPRGRRPQPAVPSLRVPKKDLAAMVTRVFESGRIAIASALPLASVLAAELKNFHVRTLASGREAYGAADDWSDENHDDLVIAIGLPIWWWEFRQNSRGGSFSPAHQPRSVPIVATGF